MQARWCQKTKQCPASSFLLVELLCQLCCLPWRPTCHRLHRMFLLPQLALSCGSHHPLLLAQGSSMLLIATLPVC